MNITQQAIQLAKSMDNKDINNVARTLKEDMPQIKSIEISQVLESLYNEKITPELLMEALHAADFSAEESAVAVKMKYENITALQMANLIVAEYSNPPISKDEVEGALNACEYSPADVASAIAAIFPTISYAVSIQNNGYLAAGLNNAYNFSIGDFTLEAWIKPVGAGTIISRKSGPGGAGNGGFLLVLRNDSTIKLATDNGFGFYEMDSVQTTAFDGNWHHIAGVRTNGTLQLYFDGNPLNGSVRNDAGTPLNVNNGMRLLIGATDQYQEDFIHYSGLIDEVRIWNMSKSLSDIAAHMNSKLQGNESGLVGYWNFDNKDGQDLSNIHNTMVGQGDVTFVDDGMPIQ